MIDFGLILTYCLVIGAMILCVVSPILQMKSNSKKTKKMIMPIIALVLVITISLFIASNEVLPAYTNANGMLISSSLSKLVGGSLITFYLLSLIAIGSVLYSEFLYKLFNNGKK
tara:strand:+ start:170 stop:511 length:342 start_codon:yes stop_codon:yes gene_type:complete